jgi:addiction module RelE/StbE family toxin
MAYKVTVTTSADSDIDGIFSYIAEELDNLTAAIAFADDIAEKYERLSDNPYIYEESRDARLKEKGYRRIVIKNFVMLYLVDKANSEVIIARVFYGRQDYPNLL